MSLKPRFDLVAGLCVLALLAHAQPVAPRLVPESLPGGRALPAELRGRLERELARRGADYVPRTRHLRPDGSPRYSNRLLLEDSPYLQQHAHNPVDWQPWGDEAFELARALDRPVLVSIGYSTCHWCHVMEEESFDDVATATLLNQAFVAIKVDREVRPDVDAVYMSAAQALGERGGWPLNVWLTPDRRPFFAGTYFPPEDRGGRPAFQTVLRQIRESYTEGRDRIESLSRRIAAAIRRDLEGSAATASTALDPAILDGAFRRYQGGFDATWGGLRRRTKFPSSLPIRFLLRQHRRTRDPQALSMAVLTLEKMAAGGLYDHLGGGFHRYSTEPRWLVPHFEKMLYDNALLLRAYTEAWQVTGSSAFARVVAQTVAYVADEMTAPSGAFYSATDADSAAPGGELEEGRFFTWTPDEIRAALPAAEAQAAIAWFGVTAAGQLDGRSILHTWRAPADVARQLSLAPAELEARLARARAGLKRARDARPAPLRDDKQLVAWNALTISALAQAGFAFDRPDWLERAARAARALLAHAVAGGRLSRMAGSPAARTPAQLEDHAFLVAALLDLHETEGSAEWLERALWLQGVQDAHFADEHGGAYFQTADDAERLLARPRPSRDGAVPSGNSVAALNLLRLHALTTDPGWLERAGMLFTALAPLLRKQPESAGELLLAVDFQLEPTREIAIVRPPVDEEDRGTAALLARLRGQFVPNRVAVIANEGADPRAARVPWLAGKRAIEGRTTSYVCIDQVCDYPTADPERFGAQLAEVLHAPASQVPAE